MTEDEARPARVRRLPSWLLNQAAARATRLVSAALTDAGSHQHQYLLLSVLTEFGPSSQASLSRHSGMDRSDIVTIVGTLAEQGLVTRSVDPANRRRNVITISEQGTAKLHRLDRLLAQVQTQVAEPLSEQERAELVRLLTRLLEHAGPLAHSD